MFWAILAIVIVLGYIAFKFNGIKSQQQEIASGRSGIEIALEASYDVLTKLNSTVNGYTGHESSTLNNVVKLRKGMSAEELQTADASLENAYRGIMAIAESYPELKASANFLHMQETINEVEGNLQASRRMYNAAVEEYNSNISRFPGLLFAKAMKAQPEEYYRAAETKHEDVKLSF